MMTTFDSRELRSLILGKFTARKCVACSGLGIIYYKWTDYANNISVDINASEYIESDSSHGCQECELCDGVGYSILEIDIEE